jgi:hypothetical protein
MHRALREFAEMNLRFMAATLSGTDILPVYHAGELRTRVNDGVRVPTYGARAGLVVVGDDGLADIVTGLLHSGRQ